MVDLYKIEKDKYGLYYVSYGKKHRIKTLAKKNNDLLHYLFKLKEVGIDEKTINKMFDERFINYHIIMINDKEYIQFGGC